VLRSDFSYTIDKKVIRYTLCAVFRAASLSDC
jgi:hypothetical protein